MYLKIIAEELLTPEDIKRGLMFEVFFMKNRPNMMEQCDEMKKKIQEIIYLHTIFKNYNFIFFQYC